MLLNPNDYTYTRFKQARGHDGDSGKIYLGKPVKTGLVTILVKSYSVTDAINEYIGCNLGQNMGINTPRAWLFQHCNSEAKAKIDFKKAVAIEYLDGLRDCGSNYEGDFLEQSMQGIMLHLLLSEEDTNALGLYNNKIYAFDFASSLYPQMFDSPTSELHPLWKTSEYNGFVQYKYHLYVEEIKIRKHLLEYVEYLKIPDVSSEQILSIYYDFKERFLAYYNPGTYMELVREIETVFSADAAEVVTILFDRMQQALVAF